MIMARARKVTVELPQDLLERRSAPAALALPQTIRTGLQLVAASGAYDRLLRMRGKIRFFEDSSGTGKRIDDRCGYCSTWVGFLAGSNGHDVQMLQRALEVRQVAMAPVVLTEPSERPGRFPRYRQG